MPIRTPEEYIESLRDGRVVYCGGERVWDVTKHPYFRLAVARAAYEFELTQDKRYQDLLCDRDEKGEPYSFVFKKPEEKEDLLRRRKIIQFLWRVGAGGSKFTGIDAMHALTGAAKHLDAAMGTNRAERVEALRDEYIEKDVSIVMAMTDVKGHRKLRPHQQEQHKDFYVHIADETDDGIIVNGCKAHISGAPLANEMIVLPCRNMPTKEDKDYAVGFSIPVATKGVTIINPAPPAERNEDVFDWPLGALSRPSHALIVFDDVFVPNERIILKGEYQWSGRFTYMFANFHRLSADAYKAVQLETLVGTGALMAEYNGLEEATNVRNKLAWLVWYAEVTENLGLAAIEHALSDELTGLCYPNPMLSNASKFFFANYYHEAIKLVQDIAGGIATTQPSHKDWNNPEIHEYIDKYLAGKAGIPTEHRLRALNLVRDLSAGHHSITTIHAEGSLATQILSFDVLADWNRYKTAAKMAAGIKMKNEEKHPLYRELPPTLREKLGL